MGEKIVGMFSDSGVTGGHERKLFYFEKEKFDSVMASSLTMPEKAAVFSDMGRLNALYMITLAGSGHIGSSFSSIDIVTCLYLGVLGEKDRYFSSKGHDSPGLYAIQTALGIVPFDMLHKLRRLEGLPGHPDINIPGTHTNTGSLGMGVSKAKGFLFADTLNGDKSSRIFVLTGDGELQEGQFWESLISASRYRDGRLTVIVDHNKIQSDTFVEKVSDLGDLEAKFRAFGWAVDRCDGHDHGELLKILASKSEDGRPKVVIADTIKGKGVSFMEHTSMNEGQLYYEYHSGAPDDEEYYLAVDEILSRIQAQTSAPGYTLPAATQINLAREENSTELTRMIPDYTRALLTETHGNGNVVVLDADLVLDTGLIPFKDEFPSRFVECGIAEQDMVSQAGTMALSGCIPVVHSFACFLTSRASEQIYNNCTQNSKIVYVGSLAGVLPGGPGHSHQAVRDVAAMMGMPGMAIVEPVVPNQIEGLLHWALSDNPGGTYLRLTSIPFRRIPLFEALESPRQGQGNLVCKGKDVLIIAFGPIMAIEALVAVDVLSGKGISAALVVTPWLNRVDFGWLTPIIREVQHVVTVENHYVEGGAGSFYVAQLSNQGLLINKTSQCLGLREIPACGTNEEVLDYHSLTGEKLAEAVLRRIASVASSSQ